ncbi:hypothetical protein SVAN01_01805 [Stagonosporopsis vannaccii]|nr:hypothetical protein SVAN01_01805 [Stagonosporopsis vannaccii]
MGKTISVRPQHSLPLQPPVFLSINAPFRSQSTSHLNPATDSQISAPETSTSKLSTSVPHTAPTTERPHASLIARNGSFYRPVDSDVECLLARRQAGSGSESVAVAVEVESDTMSGSNSQ